MGWGHFQTALLCLLLSSSSLFACAAMLPNFITALSLVDSRSGAALQEEEACGPTGYLLPYASIPLEETVRSFRGEFGLVCEWAWVAPFSGSAFFAGSLVGAAVLAPLADTHGRALMHRGSILLVFLGFCLTALAPKASAFVAGRLLTGLGLGSEIPLRYILAGELMPLNSKPLVNMCIECASSAGTLLLCGLALLFPGNWRVLTLLAGLPLGLGILLTSRWVLMEPPAFLALRDPAAVPEALARIASWGGQAGTLPPRPQELLELSKGDPVDAGTSASPASEKSRPSAAPQQKSVAKPPQASMASLLRDVRLRFRFLAMLAAWGVTSFVFYGISLGASKLLANEDGGPEAAVTATALSAAAEVPSYLIIAGAARSPSIGRRGCLVGALFCCAGACSLTTHWPTMGIFGAKFFVTAMFALCYIYTPELFPTSVRSTALGVLSAGARASSMMAPAVLALPTQRCFFIFGVSCCVAGLLVMPLPETLGRRPPETPDDLDAPVAGDRKVAVGPLPVDRKVALLAWLQLVWSRRGPQLMWPWAPNGWPWEKRMAPHSVLI